MWSMISGICLTAIVASWTGPLAVGQGTTLAALRQPATVNGTGTMTIPSTVVPASGTTTLTFTYTASADQNLKAGSVALEVPPGWTPPSATGQGSVKVACAVPPGPPNPPGSCSVAKAKLSFEGQRVTFSGIGLAKEKALTITYSDATVESSAGTATFRALEMSSTAGPLTELFPSPVVTVTCADGSGTETVSPASVKAASTSTLTFTYAPASGCTVVNGAVSLTVPPGWTLPSAAPGAAGAITVSPALPGTVVSGSAVTVAGLNLAAGQELTITYSNARAPGKATTSSFAASEQSASTGRLAPLPPLPVATIGLPKPTDPTTPKGSNSPNTGGPKNSQPPTPTGSPSSATIGPPVSSTPPGRTKRVSTGTMTVAPATVSASHPGTLTFTYEPPARGLASPGEITLLVPPGWTLPSKAPGQPGYTTSTPGVLFVSGRQIIVTGLALGPGQQLAITYQPTAAPSTAGRAFFSASDRPGGRKALTTLVASPSVLVAGPPPYHLPIRLLLILLAAGCVAAVSGIRHLRHRPGTAPAPTVAARPESGPAGTVTVQYAGTGATHAVSIEPHPDAPVTTLERMRP